MILVLSPSKTLDFETPVSTATCTQPDMLEDTQHLVTELRKYSPAMLGSLMDISDKLATLNAQRYKDFSIPFTLKNARQALMAFKGDVYEGMDVAHYAVEDFDFAQKHLRILSGLYGLLKPLDLIQPYRLEMGTRLPNARGKDLYTFWGGQITQQLNKSLAKEKTKYLINLASEEYFKAVRPGELQGEIIHVVFKENQKGALKVVGLYAKRARGLMADFIIKKQINDPMGITAFDREGYRFQKSLSDSYQLVFVR